MNKIRLIKPMAKRCIESHIFQGQLLTKNVTYETLAQNRERHEYWSQKIVGDLGRMFTDKQLANEFKQMSLVPTDDYDSHVKEKKRLVDAFARQLKWLTSLAERIDQFPQAHNTPVVSHGRAL